jgi:mannose-6-phosphate isomerase-like protein (cupin superfamily)
MAFSDFGHQRQKLSRKNFAASLILSSMPSPVNLAQKLALFSDHWAPRVVAGLNDYDVKLVKMRGEFVWHAHAETDELFLVLRGRLRIELRDGSVELSAGELHVVPRGVEHRPVAVEECEVLLVEPRGLVNTGAAGGPLTAPARSL